MKKRPASHDCSTDRCIKSRRLARQGNIEKALTAIRSRRTRAACVCRYILLREIGRYEKEKGIDRADRYQKLPTHAVLIPGESSVETSRRMRRRLGNVCRDDDDGTKIRKSLMEGLCARDRVIMWAISRRLDSVFLSEISDQILTKVKCPCCGSKVSGLNRDGIALAAEKQFLSMRATMGIPGVPKQVINATGPNGGLHSLQDCREQYREYFLQYVIVPVDQLSQSGEDIVQMCTARKKSYATLLQRILAIPGYGELNAGDLTQDFLSAAGICSDKPSRVFDDLQLATYVGIGAEKGCNWIYRGDCEADPNGTAKEKRDKWHEEILDLVSTWTRLGLGQARLGEQQVLMDPRIMEFVLCDFQRAVRGSSQCLM